MEFGFYLMDCMHGMREFPNKYFDLAIVDPPYQINIGGGQKQGQWIYGRSILGEND